MGADRRETRRHLVQRMKKKGSVEHLALAAVTEPPGSSKYHILYDDESKPFICTPNGKTILDAETWITNFGEQTLNDEDVDAGKPASGNFAPQRLPLQSMLHVDKQVSAKEKQNNPVSTKNVLPASKDIDPVTTEQTFRWSSSQDEENFLTLSSPDVSLADPKTDSTIDENEEENCLLEDYQPYNVLHPLEIGRSPKFQDNAGTKKYPSGERDEIDSCTLRTCTDYLKNGFRPFSQLSKGKKLWKIDALSKAIRRVCNDDKRSTLLSDWKKANSRRSQDKPVFAFDLDDVTICGLDDFYDPPTDVSKTLSSRSTFFAPEVPCSSQLYSTEFNQIVSWWNDGGKKEPWQNLSMSRRCQKAAVFSLLSSRFDLGKGNKTSLSPIKSSSVMETNACNDASIESTNHFFQSLEEGQHNASSIKLLDTSTEESSLPGQVSSTEVSVAMKTRSMRIRRRKPSNDEQIIMEKSKPLASSQRVSMSSSDRSRCLKRAKIVRSKYSRRAKNISMSLRQPLLLQVMSSTNTNGSFDDNHIIHDLLSLEQQSGLDHGIASKQSMSSISNVSSIPSKPQAYNVPGSKIITTNDETNNINMLLNINCTKEPVANINQMSPHNSSSPTEATKCSDQELTEFFSSKPPRKEQRVVTDQDLLQRKHQWRTSSAFDDDVLKKIDVNDVTPQATNRRKSNLLSDTSKFGNTYPNTDVARDLETSIQTDARGLQNKIQISNKSTSLDTIPPPTVINNNIDNDGSPSVDHDACPSYDETTVSSLSWSIGKPDHHFSFTDAEDVPNQVSDVYDL